MIARRSDSACKWREKTQVSDQPLFTSICAMGHVLQRVTALMSVIFGKVRNIVTPEEGRRPFDGLA